MTEYIDHRSEQELAERLAEKVVRDLHRQGPCKLVQKQFGVIVLNVGYTITIKPTVGGNQNG